jgi:hypothetical protein
VQSGVGGDGLCRLLPEPQTAPRLPCESFALCLWRGLHADPGGRGQHEHVWTRPEVDPARPRNAE